MTSDLAAGLQRPAALSDATANAWFDTLADCLLNQTHILVGGEAHRLAEIEFYYCGPAHPDPFAHRDPVQLHCGRWYFHRTRGTYRGGSFKGLDLTFGDGDAFAGVLFRSIETMEGKLIAGPSLLVDHMLKQSTAGDVASLDRAIRERRAWDQSSPLVLVPASQPRRDRVFRSARVGLTLKKCKKGDQGLSYILRPYRYLTEPRRIGKGKPHVVLALHMAGADRAEIQHLTCSPRRSIERYIADFEAGKQETSCDRYFGKDLTPAELCRLHGAWSANGEPAA